MAKIDAPEIKTSEATPSMVYVTVPDEDLYEMTHPDIEINGRKFGPGKHYVAADWGSEIERLVHNYARAQVRLNRNGQDKAVRARMDKSARSNGGRAFNPASDEL